jgi:hypothetical protein
LTPLEQEQRRQHHVVRRRDGRAHGDDRDREAARALAIQAHPQSVIVDLAVGGWAGPPPAGARSKQMKID